MIEVKGERKPQVWALNSAIRLRYQKPNIPRRVQNSIIDALS